MHENSIMLFEKYAQKRFKPGMKVLEIGPGSVPSIYQTMVGDNSIRWETMDTADDGKHTYRCQEYQFPLPDNSYDIVFSAQVIEHVRKIWKWIGEVARVCKAGGLVITINPVSWTYHEAPYDCWRIYPEGMRALYDEAGLIDVTSVWESLETPGYPNYFPGVSPTWQGRKKRFVYKILGRLGLPVERAYDTITIGKKPPAAGDRENSGN